MRLLSTLKNITLPNSSITRPIRFGLLEGIRLEINFRSQLQLYLGLQEQELAKHFRKFSKGAKTAIDIGSADGIYLLYFLLNTQIENIYAFEPGQESLKHLRTNLSLNYVPRHKNLHLIEEPVGNREGHVSLNSLSPNCEGPVLIKIDTEGAEGEILEGAQAFLKRPDTRWIIETHSLELEKICLSIFQKHNFQTQIVSPAWWRIFLPELRPSVHNRWLVAQKPAMLR